MYNYLTENPVLATAFLFLVLVIAILVLFKVGQQLGLEKIRSIVYQGFVIAENMYKHGDNQAKFDYVISLAKRSIPVPFNLLINEKLLRKVIQLWFDICKDLLDDGKLNNKDKVM